MENLNLATLLLSGLLSGMGTADEQDSRHESVQEKDSAPVERSEAGSQRFAPEPDPEPLTGPRVRELMQEDRREPEPRRLEIDP